MPVSTRSQEKRKLLEDASLSKTRNNKARLILDVRQRSIQPMTRPTTVEEREEDDDDDAKQTTRQSHNASTVICGTSGYNYQHWRTIYYPTHKCHSSEQQWQYYSAEFHAVELNAPFYRWHKRSTWTLWRDRAEQASKAIKKDKNHHKTIKQPKFVYAIKVHQYFTHWRRLTVDQVFRDKFRAFVQDCQILGPDHCGPLLLQFPAKFECNDTTLCRLEQFGELVQEINNNNEKDEPNHCPIRVALEFRHHSWFEQPQVFEIAQSHNLCVCLVHLVNKKPSGWADGMKSGFSPSIEDYLTAFNKNTTTWGMYIRFHGSRGQYEGPYTDIFLKDCLEKCSMHSKQLFVFFNNTDDGNPPSAIRDARCICNLATT